MAHSYKSQYPTKVVVDEKIVQFFEDFYRISDTPGAHEEYANYFTKDATFILASKSIKGYEGNYIPLVQGDPAGRDVIFFSLQRTKYASTS